jgi:hypothetical protein
MLKFVCKDKIEIISIWSNDTIVWASGAMNYPAIARLKEPFKRTFYSSGFAFSRKEVVKRDKSECQYCGIKLSPSKVTIDHMDRDQNAALNILRLGTMPCGQPSVVPPEAPPL